VPGACWKRREGGWIAFGRDLLHATGDRKAPRFIGYFRVSPSRWVKQPFDKQILGVESWLATTGDAELDKHRQALTLRVKNASAARVATAVLATLRGAN